MPRNAQDEHALLVIVIITWVLGFARGAPYPLASTSEQNKNFGLAAPLQ